MIDLLSAVNEATFKVLYNAVIVTRVSCRWDFSISGDVINDGKICSETNVQGGPKKVRHHQFFKKSY